MPLFNPVVFQGRNKKKDYFEGWYYKNVNPSGELSLAFIPGVSKGKDPHAFVQVIEGTSGKTWYLRFPLEDFHWQNEPFSVTLGPNRFTREGLAVDLPEAGIRGELRFQDIVEFPWRPWTPGIMGPFTFIPFMECYHGVLSMDHGLSGRLQYQGESYDFTGGRGYIEKDWGRSFPSSWVWVQGNQFENPGTSLMLSLAKIPWLGGQFNGFLGFVYYQGKKEIFATWNFSRIVEHQYKEKELSLTIKKGSTILEIQIRQHSAGELTAPVQGSMDRVIKESVDSWIHFRLVKKGQEVAAGESHHCGVELSGDVEDLFR